MGWKKDQLALFKSSLGPLGPDLSLVIGFLVSSTPCCLWLCGEGETLKTYSDRYWEMFNEIDGDFENVVIRTFKVGLPTEHDLRKSLTMKPARSMHQLMD